MRKRTEVQTLPWPNKKIATTLKLRTTALIIVLPFSTAAPRARYKYGNTVIYCLQMRQRPSSRLLIINAEGRLLLFKFEHREGPLSGQRFWATPGGGLEAGESYEQAACWELFEETGLHCHDPVPQIVQRTATFQMPDGEPVTADERFFIFRVGELKISKKGWTELERRITADHR